MNLYLLNQGYIVSSILEKILGLNRGFFSNCYSKKYDIKAVMIKEDSFLFVKLNDEIVNLLNDGYISCKISKSEIDNFDYTIYLTKNTLLGFYK